MTHQVNQAPADILSGCDGSSRGVFEFSFAEPELDGADSDERSGSGPPENAPSLRLASTAAFCAAAAGMFELIDSLSQITQSLIRYSLEGPSFIAQTSNNRLSLPIGRLTISLFGLCALYIARTYWLRKSDFSIGRVQAARLAIIYPAIMCAATLFVHAVLQGRFVSRLHINVDWSAAAVINSISIILLVPVVEEALFRGWLFARLVELKLPSAAIVLLTTLSWTFIHPLSVDKPILLIGFGLALGYAKLKSGGLVAPILMHSAINAAAGFLE